LLFKAKFLGFLFALFTNFARFFFFTVAMFAFLFIFAIYACFAGAIAAGFTVMTSVGASKNKEG